MQTLHFLWTNKGTLFPLLHYFVFYFVRANLNLNTDCCIVWTDFLLKVIQIALTTLVILIIRFHDILNNNKLSAENRNIFPDFFKFIYKKEKLCGVLNDCIIRKHLNPCPMLTAEKLSSRWLRFSPPKFNIQ